MLFCFFEHKIVVNQIIFVILQEIRKIYLYYEHFSNFYT